MSDQSRGVAKFPDARPPDPAMFGDYELFLDAGEGNSERRNNNMDTVLYWISGGFARGYRTQILGVTAFVGVVAMWAVGDASLSDLFAKLPAMLGSLGLAALGAKVSAAK